MAEEQEEESRVDEEIPGKVLFFYERTGTQRGGVNEETKRRKNDVEMSKRSGSG